MDSGAAKLNSIDDRYRANKLTLNSSSFLEGEMGWGGGGDIGLADWKTQDPKRVENARLENAGPSNVGWKTRDRKTQERQSMHVWLLEAASRPPRSFSGLNTTTGTPLLMLFTVF